MFLCGVDVFVDGMVIGLVVVCYVVLLVDWFVDFFDYVVDWCVGQDYDLVYVYGYVLCGELVGLDVV